MFGRVGQIAMPKFMGKYFAAQCGLLAEPKSFIAGESGGAPDAVIDGVTGIVVDGRNINEIAASIVRVLGDRKKLESMGSAGHEWVNSQWSWEIWAERFRDLIRV